jgi:hypothetical protein
MLCGPIKFDPADPASPPRITAEIVGYFRNAQELGKLDSPQSYQEDSCKTAAFGPKSYQRVTVRSQNSKPE